MAVTILTTENFQTEVVQAEQKVFVDFYADWCGPCQKIAPLVEQIAAERPDVKVCKLNVDEQPELAQRFGVSSIPTLAVLEHGKMTRHLVGARPKAEVLSILS